MPKKALIGPRGRPRNQTGLLGFFKKQEVRINPNWLTVSGAFLVTHRARNLSTKQQTRDRKRP